jgi:hypothetical protein
MAVAWENDKLRRNYLVGDRVGHRGYRIADSLGQASDGVKRLLAEDKQKTASY